MAFNELGTNTNSVLTRNWVVPPETIDERIMREQTAWFDAAVTTGDMPAWLAPLALKAAIILEKWRIAATGPDPLPTEK